MKKKRTEYREGWFTHRVSPFNSDVRIVISSDIQEAARRRPPLKNSTITETMRAFTATLTSGGVYVVLPENVIPSTIVHESFHVIHHVLQHHNVSFDEELYAYHLDELFDVVSAFVAKYRRKHAKRIGSVHRRKA